MPKSSAQVENKDKMPKGESDVPRSVATFLTDKGLLIAGFTAIAYFLGWRFLYFYYASFGLDSAFFSFTPIDVFSAGWRIYIISIVCIALAIFIMYLFRKLFETQLESLRLNFFIALFFEVFILNVILVIYIVASFLRVFGYHSTLGFYLYTFTTLLSLWIYYCLGKELLFLIESTNHKSFWVTLFKIIFPNSSLWLTLITIGFVVSMAFFASYLGLVYRIRDTGPNSRLPIATLYTNQPLDISGGQQTNDNEWRYDNLRFLFKNDEYYFLFRIYEHDEQGLYVVPQKSINLVQLRGWAYVLSHPEILNTPMP